MQRLFNVILHTHRPCFITYIVPVVCRHRHNDAFLAIQPEYLFRCFRAVHSRHAPVHKHHVVRLALCVLYLHFAQCLRTVRADVCPDARIFKHHLSVLSLYWIVVNDKYEQSIRVKLALAGFFFSAALVQRHHNGKYRADILSRLYIDSAVHQLDDLLCYRKIQLSACTALL